MIEPKAVEVLFIEDSEVDVELALRALRQERIEPRRQVVASEPALVQALEARAPDIILSDFSMPGFDGLRALKVSRQRAPLVPFIFVSGTIGEERAIEAIRLGATDYVLKDNMRRLGPAVRRALAESEDQARVRAAEEERVRLVAVLEATSDYVGMSDPDGRPIYLNAAGRRLLGLAEGRLPRGAVALYPEWAREILEREALPAAARFGLWQGEAAMLDASGRQVPVSQVIIAHRDPAGAVRYYSTIARDISERKAYEAHIEYLANYDALTGLANRNLLADRTVQALMHGQRVGRGCALVVFNVDRFKLLNDSYGHAAGDALLDELATRLTHAVREGDTAARLGGDVFAVLAADLGRADDVAVVLRKVAETAEQPFLLEDREVRITLSIGASVFPRDGERFDVLLRNAEAAMHRARDAGGNGFQFYAADMTRETTDRLELEHALRAALGARAMALHYQPQVELTTGRITGVEALVRWRHEARGWISPAQFIPIAEDANLIQPLGEWVLREACRQLAAWDAAGLPRLRMAVNVSARQFRDAGFVDAVSGALRENGLAPARLELELTESVLIEDRETAARVLERLKTLGVQVAIDDFGTGYSSLSYLSGLPVDCLKIDRAFVHSLGAGGRDVVVTQAIISLGRSLGLRVVAEGVETAGQRQALEAHGCAEGQGYFFAAPAAAGALDVLLREGSCRKR